MKHYERWEKKFEQAQQERARHYEEKKRHEVLIESPLKIRVGSYWCSSNKEDINHYWWRANRIEIFPPGRNRTSKTAREGMYYHCDNCCEQFLVPIFFIKRWWHWKNWTTIYDAARKVHICSSSCMRSLLLWKVCFCCCKKQLHCKKMRDGTIICEKCYNILKPTFALERQRDKLVDSLRLLARSMRAKKISVNFRMPNPYFRIEYEGILAKDKTK